MSPATQGSLPPRIGLAAVALLALAGCSYSYRNPVEALAPGEVGGRTVAGTELVIDGVAVSVRGAALDGLSRKNGRFSMLPLPAGHHTLMFRKGLERALQREVDIGYGQDGQVQGIWLGDVAIPAAVSLEGTCAPPEGHSLAVNGVAVDEVSGAVVPISSGLPGSFSFEGLAIGQHRVRVYATDQYGVAYVGGPATVEFLATDAGTKKTVARIAMHPAAMAPPVPATVRITIGVSGSLPGLKLSDLTITGLPTNPAVGSDGSAQVEVPEGLWTLGVTLPASAPNVSPPPLVTFVALAGMTIDLGTLYAVTDSAQSQAASSCRSDADCAPGTCTASHICDAGFQPPPQAPASMPFCDLSWRGCTAGQPLGGVWNDTTGSYDPPITLTCVQAGTLAVGVVCGSCCTPDGVTQACAPLDSGGCARTAGPPGPTRFAISGTISGAVVAGVQVWISSGADTGTDSDVTGAWAIAGLANGTYTFSPYSPGYTFTPASITVTVNGADALMQDFVATTDIGHGSFIWENPLPQGNQLNGTWSAASNDVWAVGAAGTVLRWNGTAWSSVWSGTTQDLTAVWGSSASDIWAVGGSGTILHWNGFGWASKPSGTTNRLEAVWGTSAPDAWAVGEAGTILHWDGATWTSVPSGTVGHLLGVCGSAANDVWAVGDDGGGFSLILHWDGATWTTKPGIGYAINGVWARAANDVWAVGQRGYTYHWTGTGWLSVLSAEVSDLQAVWGSTATDVWAVGNGSAQHWNGTSWTRSALSTPYWNHAVRGSAAGDLWVVGQGGTTYHWDGTAWTSQTTGTWIYPLSGIWGSSATDAWAVGYFGILHSTGAGWSSMTSATSYVHSAVWGSSPNDVWVTGWFATFNLHWNGVAWSTVTTPTTGYLLSIWGSSARDIWAVGSAGSILHWDGASWTKAISGTTAGLNGVWGGSATDAWAVGDGGTILHWNGTDWSAVTAPSVSFLSVWGTSASDVWAVGRDTTTFAGAIAHWNGTAWSSVPMGTISVLYGVWGTASQDVWAVGDLGMVLHWDGLAWTTVPGITTNSLYAAWGLPGAGIWAVGQDNAVVHYRP